MSYLLHFGRSIVESEDKVPYAQRREAVLRHCRRYFPPTFLLSLALMFAFVWFGV